MKVKELIEILMSCENLEQEILIAESHEDDEGEEYTIEREPIFYQCFDKVWL